MTILPADWKEAHFDEVFSRVNISNRKLQTSEFSDMGKLPVIDQGQTRIAGYTDCLDLELIPPQDGLVIFGDHTRVVKHVRHPFVVGADGVQVLRSRDGFNAEFLALLLSVSKIPNTGYNRHFKFLKDLTFACPSNFIEQEAIAEALSDADAAIESIDALIAKKRDVKQATMQQLLTGRTRLPGFTTDWKEVRLGEVGSLRGGTGFPLRFQGRKSGGVPFYKVSDMNLPGNEIRMYDSNNWISVGDSRVLGAAPFPKGSIVFAKVGAAVFLERKRILTRHSCIDNNMMAIIPDVSWMDVRFLHFALQMVRFGDLVSATSLPAINASGVAGVSLAMPALNEQEAIAEVLSAMDDELEALTEQVSKLQMVKDGMMQDLLTGKVRLV